MRTKKVEIKVNGEWYQLEVEARETLVETLRERLNLTGTKLGCGAGECGACTVLVNRKAINSCLYLTVWADGAEIETIEGLARENELHPIQKAYIDEWAVQCGFCTPGFIMATKALLDENPNPTEDEIREAVAGNFCRCTGYAKIVQAIKTAASYYTQHGKSGGLKDE